MQMSKGEICQLTVTPDLAYGEKGKPGLYPLMYIVYITILPAGARKLEINFTYLYIYLSFYYIYTEYKYSKKVKKLVDYIYIYLSRRSKEYTQSAL